ncbi:hypothetical protein ACHAP5_010419 [Fusarium lateritium]
MTDEQSTPALGEQSAVPTPRASTLHNLLPQPILNHLQLLNAGSQALPDFARFRLSRRLFAKNREHIETLCKRFDYDPIRRLISFKMVSDEHHYHTDAFKQLFEQALNAARSNCQVSQIIDKIRSDGDLPLKQTGTRFQPNGQFWHSDAKSPGLVFEVGYAQTARDLRRKAKSIIYDMNGEVTTVVCFDTAYGDNGTSKVSVHRADYVDGVLGTRYDLEPVAFHTTDDGQVANPDSELVLNLRDFALPKLSKQWPDVQITIKFAALAKAVEEATALVQTKRNGIGADVNIRKRTPSSSSGDSLPSSGTSVSSDPWDLTYQDED